MAITRLEDIIAWQKEKVLTVQLYKKTNKLNDYGFKDQIQRASVSIMNNLAEGYERRPNKEFVCFLNIAKGSCGETRSVLIPKAKLEYFDKNKTDFIKTLSEGISKMISGLMLNFDLLIRFRLLTFNCN